MPAVLAGAQEDVVGNRIQLCGSLRPGQRAAADDETDAFACQPNVVEQGGEIAGGLREPALLLDHELGDGLLVTAHLAPWLRTTPRLVYPARLPAARGFGGCRARSS